MIRPDTLPRISAAAEQLVRFEDLAGKVGLRPDQWNKLLRENRQDVHLAVLRGRVQALMKNAEALDLCSRTYSRTAVSLYLLQRDHGWPKPKRGRSAAMSLSIRRAPFVQVSSRSP